MPEYTPLTLEEIAEGLALEGGDLPGTLLTAEIVDAAEMDRLYDCPTCDGDGMLPASVYWNVDNRPLTVQFFGIGEGPGQLERFFSFARNNIRRALLELQELRAENVRLKEALKGLKKAAYPIAYAKYNMEHTSDKAYLKFLDQVHAYYEAERAAIKILKGDQ